MPQINRIKIRRGNNADLPSPGTEVGELRYSLDTKELYIDDGGANVKIGSENSAVGINPTLQTALGSKVELGGDITGTITAPVVANAAITSAKIHDAAITSAKVASGAITDAAISASANIDPAKISGLNASLASIATRAPANGVYVATDLQWGYSGGSDLTTPITNILAAIPTNGGTLFIPDGSWTATGPFTWKSGVRWLGAGRAASRLTVTGAFLTWSATCHDISVESLRITCSGGHMFNSPGGNAFYLATIRDSLLIQNSTGYGVFNHDGLDYDKVLVENCQIIRPSGSTVAAWYVRNATGAANCNTWRNLRFDSNNSTAAPCIYLESNDTSGRYTYDNTIEDILSEQSPGGVVEVYSARNLRIANVVDWDTSVTCTSDLVKIGKSAATGASLSRNVYIEKCGRRGGSGFGYGTTYDVNLIATQVKSVTVMELHNSGVSGKISFAAGDYVTLVGAPTGGIAWTGQPATATHYFGGSAVFEQGIYFGSAKDTSGTGTPEGAVTGNPGDVFRRRDGASGSTFYIKSSGTGNTGWVAAGAGGSGGTADASTNTTVSVDSEVALFSGTAGKTLKRATGTGLATLTAGVLSVTTAPAGVLVGTTATQTLTATRVRPRVTSAASSATPTPNADTDDQFQLTALAANATFAAPAGTPTDGQPLIIRIKDNGTARTLAWTGTAYRPIGVSLPTATVATKTTYLGLRYNAADAIWDVLAVSLQA